MNAGLVLLFGPGSAPTQDAGTGAGLLTPAGKALSAGGPSSSEEDGFLSSFSNLLSLLSAASINGEQGILLPAGSGTDVQLPALKSGDLPETDVALVQAPLIPNQILQQTLLQGANALPGSGVARTSSSPGAKVSGAIPWKLSSAGLVVPATAQLPGTGLPVVSQASNLTGETQVAGLPVSTLTAAQANAPEGNVGADATLVGQISQIPEQSLKSATSQLPEVPTLKESKGSASDGATIPTVAAEGSGKNRLDFAKALTGVGKAETDAGQPATESKATVNHPSINLSGLRADVNVPMDVDGLRDEPRSEEKARSIQESTSHRPALETTGHEHARPVAGVRGEPAQLKTSMVEQVAKVISDAKETVEPGRPVELQFRLEPPELGMIRVRLSMVRDRLSIQVMVREDGSRQMFEHQLPHLRERIDSTGISLDSLDVGGEDQRSGNGWLNQELWHDWSAGLRDDPVVPQLDPHPPPTSRGTDGIDLIA